MIVWHFCAQYEIVERGHSKLTLLNLSEVTNFASMGS